MKKSLKGMSFNEKIRLPAQFILLYNVNSTQSTNTLELHA